jgi:agmatine deiminase
MFIRLPAEWEEQEGVLLAWPHEDTDWKPVLEEAQRACAEIIAAIVRFDERVFLLAPGAKAAEKKLRAYGVPMGRVKIYEYLTNDTWTRDFGPITVLRHIAPEKAGKPMLMDFGFNGWGLKFRSDRDNRAGRFLAKHKPFSGNAFKTSGMILEGGSIESDGEGTLMTTSACLLSDNRNPHLSRNRIEKKLQRFLGAERVLWIENGGLDGDDTDAHVDTLARLCPGGTILYVACPDKSDSHFQPLARMRDDLARFRTAKGEPYRLLPLPWPGTRHDEDGNRLPATYANYLVINGAVLVPVYGDDADGEALKTVGLAYPDREIVGIDCSVLIRQHGSLHCVTMQFPKGIR